MSTTADLMGLGMAPALAGRLGNNPPVTSAGLPTTLAGIGTSQTGAAIVNVTCAAAPTSNNTAFILNKAASTGRPLYFWNTSSSQTALVFPPVGGTINGGAANASISVPPLSGAMFQLFNGSGVAAETWGCNFGSTSSFVTPPAFANGLVDVEQFIYAQAAITLLSQTAAQPAFVGTGGVLTNGEVTLPLGTFEFDAFFDISAMSATSASFGFSLTAGTPAVIGQQNWECDANKATLATPVAWTKSWNTAANTAVATASTATVGAARIRGTFTLTTAGPVIPNLSFGTITGAPTPIVGVGSYFRVRMFGANNVTFVGNWS